MFYAHSAQPGGGTEGWEPLRDHLRKVAARAAGHAVALGAEEEARVAGLLHDLGKYGDSFQRRLRGEGRGLDHWSAGACVALRRYQLEGLAIAAAIRGHHVGLHCTNPPALRDLDARKLASQPAHLTLTDADVDRLLARLEADGVELPQRLTSLVRPEHGGCRLARMLDVRLLFSALVDADHLETEAHFAGRGAGRGEDYRYRAPALALEPARALTALLRHVGELAREGGAEEGVRTLRHDLLNACLEAADQAPGSFTLTAPTGSGKTLAMLAFALQHAARHGLRRVVLAVPYLNILEQTVEVYRKLLEPLFGPDYVLEHHSLSDPKGEVTKGDEDQQGADQQLLRPLAQTWDAPLVVTTSVQLFESLFASRPSRCRKLHRLAGSVILFDEAQTLPPPLAVPTLAALSRLAERYGSTVVFATATQPAFDALHTQVAQLAPAGWQPREIAAPSLGLFARARRTQVCWRLDATVGWPELAAELAGQEQVLVVVNLKRHARDLAAALKALAGDKGLFHLSTNLCPGHRLKVLAQVRRRLDAGRPCRLVATQCVEAGVDLDFPAVYRAFGPLEAIAQAAGRCNRHGRRPQPGVVTVFKPADEGYPPGGYQQAASVTGMLLKSSATLDLDDPQTFRKYYRILYDLTGIGKDDSKATQEIRRAIEEQHFPDLDRLYRLIPGDTVNVLVPYNRKVWNQLRDDLAAAGHLTRAWVHKARRHAISVFRPQTNSGFFEPVPLGRGCKAPDWYVYLEPRHYHRMLGLVGGEGVWIA